MGSPPESSTRSGRCGQPVIADIDGPAYGGGFDITLTCDFRIASDRATLCSTFVRIGLLPGDGGAHFLPQLVGVRPLSYFSWEGSSKWKRP